MEDHIEKQTTNALYQLDSKAEHWKALQATHKEAKKKTLFQGYGKEIHQQERQTCCVWNSNAFRHRRLTSVAFPVWSPRSGGPRMKASAAYPKGYARRLLQLHKPFMVRALGSAPSNSSLYKTYMWSIICLRRICAAQEKLSYNSRICCCLFEKSTFEVRWTTQHSSAPVSGSH